MRAVGGSTVQRGANLLRHVFTNAREEWRWQEIKRLVRKLGYVTGLAPDNKLQEVALAFMISLRTSLRASEVLRIGPTTFDLAKRVIVVKAKNMLRSEIPGSRQDARLCKQANFTIAAGGLDTLFRKARDQVLLDELHFHDARATGLTLKARRVDILTLSRINRRTAISQEYYNIMYDENKNISAPPRPS